jgi:uncharacterized repeat protein (TIGR04076 family)
VPKIKITVLKTEFYPEIADEYRNPKAHQGPCPFFEEGQEFVLGEDWASPPEGFCGWAWTDIQRPLFAVLTGGDLNPWMKNPNTWIACCTDGVKPVTFKIERVED